LLNVINLSCWCLLSKLLSGKSNLIGWWCHKRTSEWFWFAQEWRFVILKRFEIIESSDRILYGHHLLKSTKLSSGWS
jgi:hypothetical protein